MLFDRNHDRKIDGFDLFVDFVIFNEVMKDE